MSNDELRAIAEKATPGPWIDRTRSSDGLSAGFVCVDDGGRRFMLIAAGTWDDFWSEKWGQRPEHLPANVNANNAAFIAAANPATVLGLIARETELQKQNGELKETLSGILDRLEARGHAYFSPAEIDLARKALEEAK